MFDFEKLDVYQVIRANNAKVLKFVMNRDLKLDEEIRKVFKEATIGVITNLAEGTGQMNNADKRRYLTNARSHVFVSVALMETLKDLELIDEATFNEFYDGYEQISKMLLGMIRSYST